MTIRTLKALLPCWDFGDPRLLAREGFGMVAVMEKTMPDTTPNLNDLDWSHITPEDQVQSWVDEPTMLLRWNDSVLEQMHWRRGYNAYGQAIKRHEEWKPVPTTPNASSSAAE